MAETERENIRESTLEGLDTAARSFEDGAPHEVEAFGTRLVVFRGADTGDLHA
ncbi:hypothetical protein ACIQZO_02175 [Streptomyces sp. NPDC097617]|uniref:hypothetical protein n=1 Tax=Streptomyces sp. NPDC097617 TaxID=3366091 RepID=UPI0037F8052E